MVQHIFQGGEKIIYGGFAPCRLQSISAKF